MARCADRAGPDATVLRDIGVASNVAPLRQEQKGDIRKTDPELESERTGDLLGEELTQRPPVHPPDDLTEQVADNTLRQAIARAKQLSRDANPAEGGLLAAVSDAVRDMDEHDDAERVLVGGVANLAGELAIWRAETMRRLFDAIEHEADVLRLLRTATLTGEASVTIGTEHPSTEEWEASVVAAPYRAGESLLGTIGVVGPTRMDYQTTITAVRAVAKRLSDLAEQLGG